MKTNPTLAESDAILDNLLFGSALPDTLARPKAGNVIPKGKHAKALKDAETLNEILKAQNAEIARKAKEKLENAPLIAVCLNHSCKCGNKWQSFGFFARKVTEKIEGEGDATFTRRCEPVPGERAIETNWLSSPEDTCLSCCYAPNPGIPQAPTRVGGVSMLNALISAAKVEDKPKRDGYKGLKSQYVPAFVYMMDDYGNAFKTKNPLDRSESA